VGMGNPRIEGRLHFKVSKNVTQNLKYCGCWGKCSFSQDP
jgi:hypothetical protein